MTFRKAAALIAFELMTILSGLVMGVNLAKLWRSDYDASWAKVGIAAFFGVFAIIWRMRHGR